MRKNLLTATLAAATLALAACSGDGGTGPGSAGGTTLSASEAAQLNQAILSMAADFGSGDGAARNAIPTARSTGSTTIHFGHSAPCLPSGTVSLQGVMNVGWDDMAHTSTIGTDLAVDHDACAHRLDNGEVVVISGDPDIDVRVEMATGPNGLTAFTVHETGAFSWARDTGNGGRCTLDVTAALNPATSAVTLSGSFCGFPVSGTFQGA